MGAGKEAVRTDILICIGGEIIRHKRSGAVGAKLIFRFERRAYLELP
jgi:hypothetical protein